MDKNKIQQYYKSLIPVREMLKKGLISNKDFQLAEDFLAKKYCIKKGNIYRSNDLINIKNRAIYMMPKEDVILNEQNNHKDRNITQITKKD